MPYVIVSGLPASGKSTVAHALAQELHLPLFDKDEFLERLFDEHGVDDAFARTRLSREADGHLEHAAREAGTGIVVSWWRHPASPSASGTLTEWLATLPGPLVELHCECDPAVAAHRFGHRHRHAGHMDRSHAPAELTAEFTQHAACGALRIGTLVTVRTDAAVDLPALVRAIRPALQWENTNSISRRTGDGR